MWLGAVEPCGDMPGVKSPATNAMATNGQQSGIANIERHVHNQAAVCILNPEASTTKVAEGRCEAHAHIAMIAMHRGRKADIQLHRGERLKRMK